MVARISTTNAGIKFDPLIPSLNTQRIAIATIAIRYIGNTKGSIIFLKRINNKE